MGTVEVAIRRALAAQNGGPGLTAEELAERLGAQVPVMRQQLATLVFRKDGGITCVADGKRGEGRFVLGDSTALRRVG